MKRRARELQGGLVRARASQKRIIEPRATDIQIDLDGIGALHTFSRQLRMLKVRGMCYGWRVRLRQSFTRGHVHATITLPHKKFSLQKRVLLAALLGSDLKREAFNYIRVVTRRRVPVAFFERNTRS